MPAKEKMKKTGRKGYKKRGYKKRYSNSVYRSLTDNMNIPGVENGKVVKMTYVSSGISLASTLGAQSIYTHSINNIFDPNTTGVGHQPYGHDEYANYYNQYQVLGAKVTTTARWASPLSGASVPHALFSVIDSDTTAPTTLATKMERYRDFYKVLRADTSSTITMVDYWSAKKWFKLKNPEDQHQTVGTFGGAPIKTAYHNIILQPLDESSTSSPSVMVTVSIEYVVRLLDPKPILGS